MQGHPYSEAQALAAFWRDAQTISGVTVSSQASLTGPIVAKFTEAVEGVTRDNVVLRQDGAAQPMPASRTCKDAFKGVVRCTSGVVASAEPRHTCPSSRGALRAGRKPLGRPAGHRPCR
jgi:hypothetical protein